MVSISNSHVQQTGAISPSRRPAQNSPISNTPSSLPNIESTPAQDQQQISLLDQAESSAAEVFNFVEEFFTSEEKVHSSEERIAAFKADLKQVSQTPDLSLSKLITPETLSQIEAQSETEATSIISNMSDDEVRKLRLPAMLAVSMISMGANQAGPLDISALRGIHTSTKANQIKFQKIDQIKRSEFAKSVGIDDSWKGHSQLKHLTKTLEEQGQLSIATLNHLKIIHDKHGSQTLEAVSHSINELLNSSRNLLKSEEKLEVATGILKDLAYPTRVDQETKGTCGAAAIQMKWAIEQPKNYAKAVSALARNYGHLLPKGIDIIKPNNSWKKDESDVRTISTQIVQNAIMNVGGEGTLWDSEYDSSNDGSGDDSDGGLYRDEINHALEKIMGDYNFDIDKASDLFTTRDDLVDYVEDDLARGQSVLATFERHAVLVVGMDKSTEPNQMIIATWGNQHTMTIDEFKEHVVGVQSRDDDGRDTRKLPNGKKFLLTAP